MCAFPIPANDTHRVAAVAEMSLAKYVDDPFFTHVTDMLKAIFDVPVATVSMITEDQQYFLKCQGVDLPGTPRSHSLCSHSIAARKIIVVPDTAVDMRLHDHPTVRQFGVRFAASAPVVLSNGFCMGSLCAVDFVPRDPATQAQREQLDALAGMVARFYEVPREPDPGHVTRMKDIAQKAQDEFLTLIGHEMRTPLNAIYGLSQVLEPETDDDKDLVSSIQTASEHLESVIESVLTFTELTSGDIQLNESDFSVSDAVNEIIRSHCKLARVQGKAIQIGELPKQILLRADRSQIDLLLSCVVNNCIRHGGALSDAMAKVEDDGSLLISIRDNGAGIAEENQENVWNIFAVGDDVRSRSADGIGLGLPLSRRIVEMHGGRIDATTKGGEMRVDMRFPPWRVVG